MQYNELKNERMLIMVVEVDVGKCTGCGECVDVCPVEAIKVRKGKAVIGDACVVCGACVSACPKGAISL